MTSRLRVCWGIASVLALVFADGLYALNGSNPTMMQGRPDVTISELFTIGVDSLNGYSPVGILDGLGAYDLGNGTVRILANHELNSSVGAPYTLANGTSLTGARVSYFDIDIASRNIVDAGLAYDTIIDASGNLVTAATVPDLGDGGGLARLCSSQFVAADSYGFVDNIYFTGEESSGANGGRGGYEYALDTANNTMYALPAMGYAAWENVTPVDVGPDRVGLIVGDDRAPAPLYLYVGQKDALGTGSFLDRNGLAMGNLYAWTSDNGDLTPEQFNGNGASRSGNWVEITDLTSITNQDAEVAAADGFFFSRPEDVATDPMDGTRVVMASTGRGQLYPSDNWGTMYEINMDFTFDGNGLLDTTSSTADLTILYDGDDPAGNVQGISGDFGIRSPDNLDWGDDGFIYVQEDRSTSPGSLFGADSGRDALIWRLDPSSGEILRLAEVDQTAAPVDQGSIPVDLGTWESSGILDVSALFGEAPGTLFVGDVQAHSLRDGSIAANDLVEGGQLFFMQVVPEPHSAGLAMVCFGWLMSRLARRLQ